jgi:hypothetical protein
MQIIGITGPIKHGKSTFADALAGQVPASVHLESSQIITEVTNAFHEVMPVPPEQNNIKWMNTWLEKLPPILKDVVHVDCDYDQISFTEADVYDKPMEYQKLFEHSINLAKNPHMANLMINNTNKESYRPMLQWLGGYLVQRVSPGIWYNEIVARSKQAELEGAQLCTVAGLRFPTDAQILREAGAVISEIYRPGALEADPNHNK